MKIKNILFILLALSFSFSLIFVSALQVAKSQVQAQIGVDESNTEITEVTDATEEASMVEAPEDEEVDYYLPYPGILPDHPLYWLKMARDRIMLMVSRQPASKFERLLLYADKRLGAAKALIEGGKAQLGVTTTTKAEKYMEQAVEEFLKAKENGQTTPEVETRLNKAILKHQQVLTSLLEKTPDSAKGGVEQAIEKAGQNLEKLKS